MKGIGLLNGALIFLMASRTIADTNPSEDWIWDGHGPETTFAATANAAGHMLGQFCYIGEGACYYYVNLDIKCEEGGTYPAMLNSDVGAQSVELKCSHRTKDRAGWVLIIYPFDVVDQYVKSAMWIGIAVPMESGHFKVSRFGLKGSNAAIELMRARADKQYEESDSVRDAESDEEFL